MTVLLVPVGLGANGALVHGGSDGLGVGFAVVGGDVGGGVDIGPDGEGASFAYWVACVVAACVPPEPLVPPLALPPDELQAETSAKHPIV